MSPDRSAPADPGQLMEDRLAVLSRLPGAVVVLIDLEGNPTYVSRAVESTLGYDIETFLSHSSTDLIHPDDIELAVASWEAVVATPEGESRWEHRVRHADGTWRWLEVLASNKLDDPLIRAVFLNFRDVTERREAEHALRASEARFKALVQNSYDVFAVVHPEHGIVYASPTLEDLFGRPAGELLGDNPLRFIHPDDLDAVTQGYIDAAAAPGKRASHEARILRADGTYRWIEATAVNLLENEAVQGLVVNIRDITDRRNAERESKRLTDIFEETEDLVAMADRDAGLLYLNRAAREFFSLDPEEDLTGFGVLDALTQESLARIGEAAEPTLLERGAWHGELELRRSDGSVVPFLTQILVHRDDEGVAEYYSAVLHDMSERKVFEHQLAHQAMHDPLTGLPNRTLLLDRLATAIARAERKARAVAVLFLDIDHFKVVNDSLGHALGDELLVTIAERLSDELRPTDTVARFGGDEFVVLCEEVLGIEDATAIADRLDAALRGPIRVGGTEAYVSVSIGIAVADASGKPGTHPDLSDRAGGPEALIRDADAAMYQAKERGRSRWVVFDRAMRSNALARLDTENALRRALDRGELRVHYQPVIDLRTNRACAVEALVRWQHPERGLLAPAEFVHLAEETGLIGPIGLWVLEEACDQVRRWESVIPWLPQLLVSVNLSGRQLGRPGLVEDVIAVLDQSGVEPGRVELEITESVLVQDLDLAQQTFERLRDHGVRLVVDDFGTGYSSLSYLKRFPVDLIKVDQSFVHGLGRDERDTAIVSAVVGLAHTLGLQVVGEGVETALQLDELRAVGCDRAQGYHLAFPSTASEVEAILADDRTW